MNRCKQNIARVVSLITVFLAVGAVAAVTGVGSNIQTETSGANLTAAGDTPSIGDHYPSTGNHQTSGGNTPSIGNHLPSTGNHQPSSDDSYPSTSNHQPSTGNKGPGGSTGCEGVHTPTNRCGGTEENPKEEDTPNLAGDLPSTSTSKGQTSASVPDVGTKRKKRRSNKRPTDSKKRSTNEDKTPPTGASETGAGNSVLETPGLGSTDPLLVLTSPKLNDSEVHRVSQECTAEQTGDRIQGLHQGRSRHGEPGGIASEERRRSLLPSLPGW